MRRRSRTSPPSRRKAAKHWAGRRTSGSKRPASRSCPAEKPRFPFATIFLPLPWASLAAQRTGDRGPHDYHAPELQKNHPPDEKSWVGKLAPLIRSRRGRQGYSLEPGSTPRSGRPRPYPDPGADDLGFRPAAGAPAEEREPEGPRRTDRRGEVGRGGIEAAEDEAPTGRPEHAGARRQGLRHPERLAVHGPLLDRLRDQARKRGAGEALPAHDQRERHEQPDRQPDRTPGEGYPEEAQAERGRAQD